ncbi:MAG TPA: ABC transporter substrate-binding protein [Ramlibacter sp.]|uniref:ABC transporter substrate-binding protein n=1 Tax=Ramlibacter sp. TaxID=1917967 RepID=UPI002C8D4658|nr:ABC transporter substrate-binding protein [Ramlibacter sp.]HVZ45834.1 ABC transporter substrate-binding protein [Ramlibacter sp.]
MKRRIVLSGFAAASAASILPAWSQTPKIVFGYTAVSDFASVFVAREEGIFARHGIDVEPKFIPLNPSIPAAIQSDSLQMGGPTPSVYLQAVDGGLDHVVVGGGGMTSSRMTGAGFVARSGTGIHSAHGCVGRKIGVPGLGAYLHVTFRAWLMSARVNPDEVNFVEASFPQHGDLLRSGSLDGVVTADPFMGRIVDSGIGYVAAYYTTFLPEGNPTILYTARRDWANRNKDAVKAFQESIVEAAAFMNHQKNNAKVREDIGKYIKLPPDVLAKAQISPPAPLINEKQLTYWVEVMKAQKMLKTTPQVAQLIVK